MGVFKERNSTTSDWRDVKLKANKITIKNDSLLYINLKCWLSKVRDLNVFKIKMSKEG